MTRTFDIVAYDEGGVQRRPKAIRLVCLTDTGQKVAVWGTWYDTANIDAVLAAGLPCRVECETGRPDEWAVENYGHDYWVAQDAALQVI